MRIAPCVRAASPVQGEEHQGRAADKQCGANGVTSPHNLRDGHLGILDILGRPVEQEEAHRRGAVEGRLHPEDVPPAAAVDGRDCARDKRSNSTKGVSYLSHVRLHLRGCLLDSQAAQGSGEECKTVGNGAVLQGQHLGWDGLDNGDGGQRCANEDAAADEHAHRGRLGGDNGPDEGD